MYPRTIRLRFCFSIILKTWPHRHTAYLCSFALFIKVLALTLLHDAKSIISALHLLDLKDFPQFNVQIHFYHNKHYTMVSPPLFNYKLNLFTEIRLYAFLYFHVTFSHTAHMVFSSLYLKQLHLF
jgi:hypothetical protein